MSSSSGTGHSLAVFMLRDERPVLRPVALMGEPGSAQWDAEVAHVREELRGVRGTLVMFPRNFLHAEHLGPGIVVDSLLGARMFQ